MFEFTDKNLLALIGRKSAVILVKKVFYGVERVMDEVEVKRSRKIRRSGSLAHKSLPADAFHRELSETISVPQIVASREHDANAFPLVNAILESTNADIDSEMVEERTEMLFSAASRPCIFVTRTDLYMITIPSRYGVHVFGINRMDETGLVLVDRSGTEFTLTAAPTLLLGMLALSDMSLGILDGVRKQLTLWSDLDFPFPHLISPEQAVDVLSVLLSTSLVDRLRYYANHITYLSKELLRLRSSHEDMMNAFSDLERFVSASERQPCDMTFENPPIDSECISPTSGSVSQLLPVSSFGLSIIQLHLQNWLDTETRTGGIALDLRSLESPELQQTWHFTLDQLEPGWISLPLNSSLGGRRQTPILTIRPLGGLGVLPPLSLGMIQPISAYRLRGADVDDDEVSQRSLALRTWSGLPGVRPPNFNIKSVARSKVHEIPVPFTMLRDVKQVTSNWTSDFDPIEYLPAERGILCHPPPSGTIWGELKGVPAVDQPFRLSVRTSVRSEKSKPVEFGIAFATDFSREFRDSIKTGSEETAFENVVFSGWHRVAYGTSALLSIVVDKGEAADGSIFFATRMADNEDNSFAWAYFFDLRKTLLGGDISKSKAKYPELGRFGASNMPKTILASEGIPFPIYLLETVMNFVSSESSEVSLVTYDSNHCGIMCHPSARGITLGYLSGVSTHDPFWLLTYIHIGNHQSEPIEFGLVISPLPANEVLARLNSASGSIRHDDFVFSGWQTAVYGSDIPLDVNSFPIDAGSACIYFATRMAPAAVHCDFAWAYFKNIRTIRYAKSEARLSYGSSTT